MLGMMTILCPVKSAMASERLVDSCSRYVVVNDYLAPLDSLPEQKGFPVSGKLGFGPGSLRVYPPRDELVVAGRDRIEASGALWRRSRLKDPLEWAVQSKLVRLGGQGRPSRTVKIKGQRVGTVAGFAHRQFGFGSSVAPGIYRLQVSFSKKRALLGTFKEYFRVVPARSSLHLRAPRSEVQAGAVVALRVENLGTVSATYDAFPRLYSPDGSEVAFDHGIGGAIRPVLQAGVLSPCIEISLPASLSAGDYRVTLGIRDRTMKHAESISTVLHISAS